MNDVTAAIWNNVQSIVAERITIELKLFRMLLLSVVTQGR